MQELAPAVEALLFTVEKPLSAPKIAEAVRAGRPDDEVDAAAITAAIESLNAVYDDTGRAFRIEPVAGGFRVMARPEHAAVLAAFHRKQTDAKLSRPAIETLAIIAYRQPITRGRLEAIRGVACGEVLKGLLERKLVTVTGRAEEPGRPMLYGTTKHFLDAFGLASIKDLPPAGELGIPEAAQPEHTASNPAPEETTAPDDS